MKRLLPLLLLCFSLYALDVQKILDEKSYFRLLNEMELLTTHESMDTFPLNAKAGDQVILTNDYHLRQLWEFDGESWNAWENETLNILLNKPEQLLQKEPVQQPISAHAAIRFIQLEATSLALLQEKLNHYLSEQDIGAERVVSIQLFPSPDSIRLVFSYR